ncbi:Conserved_hypothetical protein [Hexamita inflata]|uniref:Uncharacterized protein n=1 Tax=Hexamita inflata TaxID=28002 RepID=A0ABP1HCF1_9EUKA
MLKLKANQNHFAKIQRTYTNNSILLSAVQQLTAYSTDKIPDFMFQKTVAMFVNVNNIARKNNYMWAETYCGAQALIIPPGLDTDLFVTLYSKQDITIEFQFIEKVHQYNIDQGKYKKVSTTSAEKVDFVLDSAYALSGAIIETCTGSLKSRFSYYHMPSSGEDMSKLLVSEGSAYGQVKAVLNSTDDHQNFFATIETSDYAEFIVYHSYIDTRPQVSSQNIRVNMSSKDGFLTIVVDPASYLSGVFYMVYVLTDAQGNQNTACGIRRGQLISNKVNFLVGQSVVSINTTIALQKGEKYWLNVIAVDSDDINIAMAYKPIQASLDMELIDEEYYENQGNVDITWIIWVVLTSILIVVMLVAIFFIKQRKKYIVIVDQSISRNKNAQMKTAQHYNDQLEDSL